MAAKTPVQVRFLDEERDALDNYRREQLNPPSRAQAARELIRHALDDVVRTENASKSNGALQTNSLP
jgi:hypothetical protein